MDKNVEITRGSGSIKAKLGQNGAKPAKKVPELATMERLNEQFHTLTGLIQRVQLAQMAGLQFDGERDLYNVFGYKKVLTPDHFLAKYTRQDIVSRIIDAPPLATWSRAPVFADESLIDQFKVLNKRLKLWLAMYRADRLARLNHFSLLLFGFDDANQLSRQLNEEAVNELLYVRAIPSRLVDEVTFEDNVQSPRFGYPTSYKVSFDDPTTKHVSSGAITVKGNRQFNVHHSRVIHIVENPLEDTVFGIPIIEKVYNLLDDLLKVSGGTSETYWLSGRGGLQANIDKEMELDPADTAELSDEIDEYMHQLRRFIRTRGVDISSIDTRPPNPKETFEMIVTLISGTTGIPKRILLGSEAGQLASEQDRANWAERIEERRTMFANPSILDPTLELLQRTGIIDAPEEIEYEWPSAFVLSPLEENQSMAQKARAIGNISRQTGNKTPMQLTSREEAREIIGLSGDLAESDLMETEVEPEQSGTPVGQLPSDSPDGAPNAQGTS